MPIVSIQLLEGRDEARKRAAIKRVTEALVETLGVRAEQVRVVLQEVPSTNWGIGGDTVADLTASERR